MRITLPYPSNWSDFQDLCFQLWKEMWGDPNAHQNGRNGQSQNGVDIWGKKRFDREYTGIQCKGKNENYDSKLITREIDNECDKAVKFEPSLKSFIMATTSPRDVMVQQHCRNLTQQQKYPFSVDTWSWDDIEDEVQSRPTLMERFYPTIKNAELLSEIQISVFASVDKLYAFFSRPGLFNKLNSLALNILRDLAYEIAINAFEHGQASTFGIKVENDRVYFTDDGKPFDSSKLLDGDGRGGKETMKYAADFFEITYRYDTQNILEVILPDNLQDAVMNQSYTINLSAEEVFVQVQTEGFVINKLMRIPTDCKKIILDSYGEFRPSISCSYTVIDTLLKLKGVGQTIVVYVPENLYYIETLNQHYSSRSDVNIKIKD